MTLTTRTITNAGAPLHATDGAILANATITFALVDHIGVRADTWDAVTSERVGGDPVVVTTDASGEFTVALWPNSRGSTATRYLCTVNSAGFRPFYGVVEDAAQPLPWVSFMASGSPLTPQEISQLTQYLDEIEAAKLEAEAARDAAEDAAQAAVAAHTAAGDPHPQYTTAAEAAAAAPVQSVAGRTGAVTLAKADVGLGNVDNTSDANKPVSTAQQTALNLKAPLASPTFTGTVSGITKSMVGLGNVDNTADSAKPVSTAQAAAIATATAIHPFLLIGA